MTLTRHLLIAIFLGFFGAACTAFAQETASEHELGNEYDLEMIVFVNHDSNSTEVERSDSDSLVEQDRTLRQLFERTGKVTAAPVTESLMPEVANRLRDNPDYQVIQHVAWRQRVDVISNVPYIDVSALSLGEESGLRGVVRFYHSPLLYVDVVLKYTPFADPLSRDDPLPVNDLGEPAAPDITAWFLHEKRRLKLKEIHYLDSPHLGVIIGTWPVDQPVE